MVLTKYNRAFVYTMKNSIEVIVTVFDWCVTINSIVFLRESHTDYSLPFAIRMTTKAVEITSQ